METRSGHGCPFREIKNVLWHTLGTVVGASRKRPEHPDPAQLSWGRGENIGQASQWAD
jgi:hypothetical protein